MAVTPPNTTARYKVHYHGPFGAHTMLFHAVTGQAIGPLRLAVAAILTAMSGMTWNGTTFDIAEFAAAGSNFFTPDAFWTPITRTSATNPAATDSPSHFAQFGGRSPTTGKRVKWYLFEDTLRDTLSMRFQGALNADVAAVYSAIVANESVVGAIDGTQISAYNYANVGQNDYLTHKARS